MKLKSGFMLREIAGQWILVPLGQRTVEFNAIMNLSETGALIWKGLENNLDRDAILERIMTEYDVNRDNLIVDYHQFLDELKSIGLVEHE